jgi:hypothetical protein
VTCGDGLLEGLPADTAGGREDGELHDFLHDSWVFPEDRASAPTAGRHVDALPFVI